MKKNINLMAPQWIEYPALSEFSMGWRMGAGEDYKCDIFGIGMKLSRLNNSESTKRFSLILASGIITTGK